MPMPKGNSKSAQEERFHEFRKGKTYAKTRAKYGKDKANAQLKAVALKKRKS
jgi:hypothetical protein